MRNLFHNIFRLIPIIVLLACVACQQEREHTAPAIYERDSVAMMTSYGVNTLISDSGVIKYRIVAERWEVNEARNPSRWIFDKGVLLTQFDQTFHIQSYIQCDTAYYFVYRLNERRIKDYPNLWNYAKNLYSLPEYKNTTEYNQAEILNKKRT